MASPPPSSPTLSLPASLKRTGGGDGGDDENIGGPPPQKRRLLGRALGSELREIESNAVSNPISDQTSLTKTKPAPSVPTSASQDLPTPPADEDALLDYDRSSQAPGLSTSSLSSTGSRFQLRARQAHQRVSYERLIAQRSEQAETGKPQKDYYGINIHELLSQAEATIDRQVSLQQESAEPPPPVPSIETGKLGKRARLMWTEKYRAKKFTDLCGDERTHRQVLRWLKSWDHIVFPGAAKSKPKSRFSADAQEEQHRKILLLAGSPGLGKTTLAHVCAKQAGYEGVEVNASDERSASVVKNKIRDCLGTENVRGINTRADGSTGQRRPGKPVCVILDEVDGVAGNSGSGDGGFMKALVDLVMLDQKNSKQPTTNHTSSRKKGDKFRMLRPLILVCNDVYASPLRPLRAAGIAEIIHVRKPPLDKVIDRVKHIFHKEGLQCDDDSVRRLCEHTWGIGSKREARAARSSSDGDMRSILVTAEWVAKKLLHSSSSDKPHLTKAWMDEHIIRGSADGETRGLGRGGAREVADRVFMENAGFRKKGRTEVPPKKVFVVPGAPKPPTDAVRYDAIRTLRECIDTIDEHDRVMTEVFTAYPTYTFQDDTILTKPNTAYEWLDFHDRVSSKVFNNQEWELKPYQSTPTLAFHYLFGNGSRQAAVLSEGGQEGQEEDTLPFAGPRASFDAFEYLKETRACLSNLQACEDFNIDLKRMFHRPEELAIELVPHLMAMLTPDVKPVLVGGKGEQMASVRRESEREMVRRSVEAMSAVGVVFEKLRVEDPRAGHGGFVYRMEPALDGISTFESLKTTSPGLIGRYAVRQIMQQEHRKYTAEQHSRARQARWRSGAGDGEDEIHANSNDANKPSSNGPVTAEQIAATKVKRDFFGRIIRESKSSGLETSANAMTKGDGSSTGMGGASAGGKVQIWATFNEGFSNAVKKPISLKELLDGL